jgi:hypothetical protein
VWLSRSQVVEADKVDISSDQFHLNKYNTVNSFTAAAVNGIAVTT